jgi:hypothetical protein
VVGTGKNPVVVVGGWVETVGLGAEVVTTAVVDGVGCVVASDVVVDMAVVVVGGGASELRTTTTIAATTSNAPMEARSQRGGRPRP